jgi:acyl-[acyl-carrier-protein]-phospholipid O-acyltransferase/long-chain-fatty-acid--[acyl-carrier-protein] ligase
MTGEPANGPGGADRPWERGFWSLIVTQFQGAFSDNALKNLVIFLIVASGHSESEKHRIGELVGALFALPFILFSMAGGYLADRHSKRTITIGVKIFEVFVMLFATAGLMLNNLPMQLAAVFGMGAHSAFFGPSKYGLLPELLPEKRLSWGNGILELGTFTAIILGTVAAAFLATHLRGHHGWSGLILIGLALLGLGTSLGITPVPPADPQRQFQPNFLVELGRQVKAVRRDRPLLLAMLGNTYFNFLGALLLLNLFFYGADVLRVGELKIGYLNTALALGIGVGSFAAGCLSGGKIEYGLIPLGALGLSLAATALAAPGLSYGQSLVRLALLGTAGGFFIVPICALLQHRPEKGKKGGVLATANLFSFVGVFLASGAHYVLTQFAEMSPGTIFLAGGVLTLAGAIYVVVLVPDSLLRLVLWALTHSLYRIRVEGRDNIPPRGGALFVCNHLSMIDALLLQASTDRPLRFIMLKRVYDRPWIKPFARLLRVIPISSELRPREMVWSLRTASDAIKDGEVVCIFAEGQVTRIGQMLPFRRGLEKIMRGLEAPIIPVALDGVWGSVFSYEHGRFRWKWPQSIPYPIGVNYGKAMPPDSTAFAVREAVQELLAQIWRHRRARMVPLHRWFLRTGRAHPWRFAMADARTPRLLFGAALARVVFLARRLRRVWADQEMVGVLLPPSVPGALVNVAALLLGKVPVNLNYTVSADTLESCSKQCGLQTVVTSRAFLEQVKLAVPGRVVLLEEFAAEPSWTERLTSALMAWCLPARWLERALGRKRPASLEDLATTIFSSGSTGDPKGIMLSHFNVGSNIQQMAQTLPLDRHDRVLGVLPFFHSFGFTATLWLPAVLGIGVVYHPTPLDAKAIGELTQHYAATFLLGTPTFLQLYLRGCAPGQFGSLRFVVAGAEKLPEVLAAAFEERFGIRPLEAYGCTECSPAVTVNTHDFRAAGYRQVGAKRGRIGHPLPGVGVRIVHPESFAPLPVGQAGLLLVRGPNVMQGYLGRPDLTAAVLRDGWYVTGDMAMLDEDGFLTITDRLSRFSKIGGEMVPHLRVEEKLHDLAGVAGQTFAVTGVAEDEEGERLVVLHTLPQETAQAVLAKLPQLDLPKLWIPRPDQFYHVDSLPVLGSGKMDLRKVRGLAARFALRDKAPTASDPADNRAASPS